MLERILIVADDSDPARRAAAIGYQLAGAYESAVDVLYVLEPETGSDESGTERATTILEETTADRDAPGPVETHVEEGQPAGVVTDFAADRDVDLVVMGRRGRSGLGDRLLGSVTERVLRGTTVPVLAVPADDGSGDVEGIEDVLVTTDGSDVAENAAPYAGDFASRFGATLHVVTAVDVAAEGGVFDAGGVPEEYVERLESERRDALDRFVATIDDADVEVRTSVIRATPRDAVAEYVDDNDVDLLVMASEGQNNVVGQRLGSVAARVLGTVDVPVLVVPTPE